MPDCTIEIKDEVNVKIHDLDLPTRRQLEKKFKYFSFKFNMYTLCLRYDKM